MARLHIRPDDASNNNNRGYLDSFGGTFGWNRGSPKTNPLHHSDFTRHNSVLVRNDPAVKPPPDPSIGEMGIFRHLSGKHRLPELLFDRREVTL